MRPAAPALCAWWWALLLLPATAALQLWPARYEKPQAESVRTGRAQLEKLENDASSEGFLAAMFGTDCFSQHISALKGGCNSLEYVGQMELSYKLMNCHLAASSRPTHPCPERQPVHLCLQVLPSDVYVIFTSFSQNIPSICIFMENADFEKRAERLLQELYQSGVQAAVNVHGLTEEMTQQTAAVGEMVNGMGSLAHTQKQVAESVEEGLAVVQGVQQAAGDLLADMAESKVMQRALAASGRNLTDSLQALHADERQHAAAAALAWQAAEDQAARVAHFQEQSEAARAQLVTASEALMASSVGVQAGMAALQSTQEQSHTLLAGLLGASYSWSDVCFYLGGALFALALGGIPATHGARAPLLAALALALATERSVLDRSAGWTTVGSHGQAQVQLPLPWSLLMGPMTQDALKMAIRRTSLATFFGILVFVVWRYEGPQTGFKRLLRRLDGLEARHEVGVMQLSAQMRAIEDALLSRTYPADSAGASLPVEAEPYTSRGALRTGARAAGGKPPINGAGAAALWGTPGKTPKRLLHSNAAADSHLPPTESGSNRARRGQAERERVAARDLRATRNAGASLGNLQGLQQPPALLPVPEHRPSAATHPTHSYARTASVSLPLSGQDGGASRRSRLYARDLQSEEQCAEPLTAGPQKRKGSSCSVYQSEGTGETSVDHSAGGPGAAAGPRKRQAVARRAAAGAHVPGFGAHRRRRGGDADCTVDGEAPEEEAPKRTRRK